MLPAPRVIAIDDEREHLDGLTNGLNRCGAACLPYHFTGEPEDVLPCPHVRVIFADLHLVGSFSSNHAQDFSMIGGLLEKSIKPTGPYAIVLWTMYPVQSDALHNFLKNRLRDVKKPFAVLPLDKKDHLNADGQVKDIDALIKAINSIMAEQPQIGALLNWEERILGAAADSVSSLLKLADPKQEGQDLHEDVGRILAHLAKAAVGKDHVKRDRFRAVNEALLPILADRIATMRTRKGDDTVWRLALDQEGSGGKLSEDEAAGLNRLLHIAPSTSVDSGTERGAVIALPDEFTDDTFNGTFGLSQKDAAKKQFCRKQIAQGDDPLQWVLVQTQAACDYAQTQPGPLPFHLGLCMKAESAHPGSGPAALWRSPRFDEDSAVRVLHVNARFMLSIPRDTAQQKEVLFRLREQVLNDLIYKFHSYGARPGIISIRGGS